MIDQLIVALVGTFILGLATWQVTRVIADGDIFKPMRTVLWDWYQGNTSRLYRTFYTGISCRLCFGQQVAFLFTWGTLLGGLLATRGALSSTEWAFAFTVGPVLTGAWHEIIRKVEAIEAPE